jgi:hypothetical protein
MTEPNVLLDLEVDVNESGERRIDPVLGEINQEIER